MTSDPTSLDTFASQKLHTLEQRKLRRSPRECTALDAVRVMMDSRELINFCSNDYLGLAHHPQVKEAAARAALDNGAGAGASRLVTGGHARLFALEKRLAAFKGTQDCVIFGSGYMANMAITPALAGPDDIVFIDERAHACLFSGAQLSRATLDVLPHNDTDALADRLDRKRRAYRHALVLVDSVYSMDGDLAPLDVYARISARHDAWLLVDDAHGLGVLGSGRGAAETFTPKPDIPLQMGTLSKALGSYGGYLCASHEVCELMRSRARPLIYTTALPPAVIAAAEEALTLIETDPELCARPLQLARLFAAELGLDEPQSPIVPVILGDAETALAASDKLREDGYLVMAIRPPTVAEGTARLRVTFSAAHSEESVKSLAASLKHIIQD